LTRPVAVITGASSGIGAVFARKLAPSHDLILIARRKDRLDALAAELAGPSGARISVLAADLTEQQGLVLAAERVAAEPALALLINNAGFGVRGILWQTDLEPQQRMHRLHVTATLELSHAALGNLVPKNSGGIINVASVAGFVRRRGSVSYSASKAWVIAFTEGLRVELGSIRSAVKVQALCPGFTYSEFHDTMRADRAKLASRPLWLSADFVVDESLKGLAAGRFLVVPNWRYKLIVSCITKLPTRLRIAVEDAISSRK
jgi:uncharacterized protein